MPELHAIGCRDSEPATVVSKRFRSLLTRLPPVAAALRPRVGTEAERKDIEHDQEREQNEQFHHRHAFR